MRPLDSVIVRYSSHISTRPQQKREDLRTEEAAATVVDQVELGDTAKSVLAAGRGAASTAENARGFHATVAPPGKRDRFARRREAPCRGDVTGQDLRRTDPGRVKNAAEKGAFMIGGQVVIRMQNGKELSFSAALGVGTWQGGASSEAERLETGGADRRRDPVRMQNREFSDVAEEVVSVFVEDAETPVSPAVRSPQAEPMQKSRGSGWVDETDAIFDRLRLLVRVREGEAVFTPRELNIKAIFIGRPEIPSVPETENAPRSERSWGVNPYLRGGARNPQGPAILDITV
jgi:hypothetical protein